MVSFTDAQTSGFALKEGQSHATSLQCMTKSEILAKYTLDIGTTYSNPYASNQLVPVVDWIPKGTGYCPTVSDLSSITTSYSGFGGYGTWTFSFTYIGTQTTTATLWYRTRRDGVYTPNQVYPPHRLTTEFIPGQTYTITAGYAESPTVYLDFELFECSETVIAPYEYYVNYDVNEGTTEGYITACAFGPAAYKVYASDSTLTGLSYNTVIYQDPYGFPYYHTGGVERWLAIGETEDGPVTYGLRLNTVAAIQQKVSCAIIYYNTQQSGTATRNNCPEGYSPGDATLVVMAETYSSLVSVADANSQAQAYIDANKQAYANANATCTLPVTVSLGSLTCNTLSGGDGSITKRWSISTTNPPDGYTVTITKVGTTLGTISASIVTLSGTKYVEAVFGNSFAQTDFKLSLNNSSGQEVAYGTTTVYGTYNSAIPTCNVYYNTQQSGTATRNDCPVGYTAGDATLTVAANTYTSVISIADANSKAQTYIDANKQAYANANATCTAPIYYNTQQSGTATRNNCPSGYTAGDATLVVAANTYSSLTSVEDANNQAIAYIDANKQAYANANGTCTAPPVLVSLGSLACNTLSGGDGSVTKRWSISTTNPPDNYTISASKVGTTLGTISVNVVTIGGTLYAEAVFGNSSAQTDLRLSLKNASGQEVAYGTTTVYGTYSSFMPTCTVYYNTQQSGTATRDNCSEGYTGSEVTLTVAANTYTSVTSIADANSKAVAYINANKQTYANTNGTCTAPTVYYNTEQSTTATKNDCSSGYIGSTVEIVISANEYSSLISVADANNQVIAYLDANKQSIANAEGSCSPEPSVTYDYYGNLFYNDPCQGSANYYIGSDGEWYEGDGTNFTEVTGQFVNIYSYYDWGSDQYYYDLYNLAYGGTLTYWGTTTSQCPPY
jgi:hypothetical protein